MGSKVRRRAGGGKPREGILAILSFEGTYSDVNHSECTRMMVTMRLSARFCWEFLQRPLSRA